MTSKQQKSIILSQTDRFTFENLLNDRKSELNHHKEVKA